MRWHKSKYCFIFYLNTLVSNIIAVYLRFFAVMFVS